MLSSNKELNGENDELYDLLTDPETTVDELKEFLSDNKNIDLNERDILTGESPIFWAVADSSLDIVRYLVEEKKIQLDVLNEDEENLLHAAMTRPEIIDYFCSPQNKLYQKINPEMPSHEAFAYLGDWQSVLDILTDMPRILDAETDEDISIFYWAGMGGQYEALKQLFDCKFYSVLPIKMKNQYSRHAAEGIFLRAREIEEKLKLSRSQDVENCLKAFNIAILYACLITNKKAYLLIDEYQTALTNFRELFSKQITDQMEENVYQAIGVDFKLLFKENNKNKKFKSTSNLTAITEEKMMLGENIKALALSWGFDCIDVARDGNCFFHAIANQFERSGLMDKTENIANILRSRALKQIEKHYHFYEKFIIDHKSKEADLAALSQSWADEVLILALVYELNLTLVIIRDDGEDIKIYKTKDSLMTVYLGYEVGFHYCSLTKNPDIDMGNVLATMIDETTCMDGPAEPDLVMQIPTDSLEVKSEPVYRANHLVKTLFAEEDWVQVKINAILKKIMSDNYLSYPQEIDYIEILPEKNLFELKDFFIKKVCIPQIIPAQSIESTAGDLAYFIPGKRNYDDRLFDEIYYLREFLSKNEVDYITNNLVTHVKIAYADGISSPSAQLIKLYDQLTSTDKVTILETFLNYKAAFFASVTEFHYNLNLALVRFFSCIKEDCINENQAQFKYSYDGQPNTSRDIFLNKCFEAMIQFYQFYKNHPDLSSEFLALPETICKIFVNLHNVISTDNKKSLIAQFLLAKFDFELLQGLYEYIDKELQNNIEDAWFLQVHAGTVYGVLRLFINPRWQIYKELIDDTFLKLSKKLEEVDQAIKANACSIITHNLQIVSKDCLLIFKAKLFEYLAGNLNSYLNGAKVNGVQIETLTILKMQFPEETFWMKLNDQIISNLKNEFTETCNTINLIFPIFPELQVNEIVKILCDRISILNYDDSICAIKTLAVFKSTELSFLTKNQRDLILDKKIIQALSDLQSDTLCLIAEELLLIIALEFERDYAEILTALINKISPTFDNQTIDNMLKLLDKLNNDEVQQISKLFTLETNKNIIAGRIKFLLPIVRELIRKLDAKDRFHFVSQLPIFLNEKKDILFLAAYHNNEIDKMLSQHINIPPLVSAITSFNQIGF